MLIEVDYFHLVNDNQEISFNYIVNNDVDVNSDDQ